MRLKNSVVLTSVFAILLCVVAAKAETIEGEENKVQPNSCREERVSVRSVTPSNVHLSEEDEGAIITLVVCGGSDSGNAAGTTDQGSNNSAPGACPPGVQDCIGQ